MIKEVIARYHQQIPTLANIKDELSLDSSVLQLALKIAVKDRQAFMIGESRFLLPEHLLANMLSKTVIKKSGPQPTPHAYVRAPKVQLYETERKLANLPSKPVIVRNFSGIVEG